MSKLQCRPPGGAGRMTGERDTSSLHFHSSLFTLHSSRRPELPRAQRPFVSTKHILPEACKHDAFERIVSFEKRAHLAHRDFRRFIDRVSVDPATDGREG